MCAVSDNMIVRCYRRLSLYSGVIAFLGTDARETSDVAGAAGSNSARGPSRFFQVSRNISHISLLLGYIPDRTAKSSGFWTVEYYQPYFDIDTKTVSGGN